MMVMTGGEAPDGEGDEDDVLVFSTPCDVDDALDNNQQQQSEPDADDDLADALDASATRSVDKAEEKKKTAHDDVPENIIISQTPPPPPPPPQRTIRPPESRPIHKLSVGLLKTYKHVNEVYHAAKRKRQAEAAAGGGLLENSNAKRRTDGDPDVRAGDVLHGRYEIITPAEKPLGRGSFGVVVKALDRETSTEVALKIVRAHSAFFDRAQVEKATLRRLRARGDGSLVDKFVVRLLDDFVWKDKHQCFVFELLHMSLYGLLRRTHLTGVSLGLTRKFAQQLADTLYCLSHPGVDVIHCDLKPENVLLVNGLAAAIKLVDFGSSCSLRDRAFSYIQSRFYRAPEVLLELPYDHAIDMWSLGCLLVELHVGRPLFPGRSSRDQLLKICEYLGLPPEKMLRRMPREAKLADMFVLPPRGRRFLSFFQDAPPPAPPPPIQFKHDGKVVALPTKSLRDLIGVDTFGPSGRRKGQPGHAAADYSVFLDLVTRMLAWDPWDRITAKEALRHPFLALSGHTATTTTTTPGTVVVP